MTVGVLYDLGALYLHHKRQCCCCRCCCCCCCCCCLPLPSFTSHFTVLHIMQCGPLFHRLSHRGFVDPPPGRCCGSHRCSLRHSLPLPPPTPQFWPSLDADNLTHAQIRTRTYTQHEIPLVQTTSHQQRTWKGRQPALARAKRSDEYRAWTRFLKLFQVLHVECVLSQ